MAVVGSEELNSGRQMSGVIRESLSYDRVFLVQTTDLKTPLLTIALAPGVKLGDAHPENAACYCKSFDVSHAGGAQTLYQVTFKYEIYKEGEPLGTTPFSQLPPNKWSGGSSITQVPTLTDRLGKVITNSAGTVIPDLQRDNGEFTLTLVRCYAEAAFSTMSQAIVNLTNTVNNATWVNGAAGTWKCQGAKWQKQVETDDAGARFAYYECTWEFAYRAAGWNLQPLDVGFVQKVDKATGLPSKTGTGKADILGEDGKSVKEPRALDAGIEYTGTIDGVNWPKVIVVDTYQQRDFATSFGTPS